MNNIIPFLSICIPTYNRADKLKISLNAILIASEKYKTLIEVIVSDNCSSDNTQDIVTDLSRQNDNLFYYRNNANLGFNKNLFLLTDIYAKGKYCWVIGDDDYVDIDSITHILNILQSNENLKLLVINFRFLSQNEYDVFTLRKTNAFRDKVCFENGSFAKAIDSIVSPGNLLGTFMSCHVFHKNIFSEFPKEIFSADSLDNFYSTFPNAYIIAKQLINSPVVYTQDPLITCVPHKKSWDDKLQYIYSDPIPKLYKNYLKLGYLRRELTSSRRMIIYMNLSNMFSNLRKIKAVSRGQVKLSLLSIFYPSIYFFAMKKLIRRKTR